MISEKILKVKIWNKIKFHVNQISSKISPRLEIDIIKDNFIYKIFYLVEIVHMIFLSSWYGPYIIIFLEAFYHQRPIMFLLHIQYNLSKFVSIYSTPVSNNETDHYNIIAILLMVTYITNNSFINSFGYTAIIDFQFVTKIQIFLNSTPFNLACYRIW